MGEYGRFNILTGWALRFLFAHEPRFVFVDVIGYGWAVSGNVRLLYKAAK